MSTTTSATILGAGALGAAMAARLGETNHQVRLWNRTSEKAQAVASETAGVTAVLSVGEAVLGARDALCIDHDSFVEALEAGPLAMPYALQKLQLMDVDSYQPGFTVRLGLEDIDLAGASFGLSPLLQTVRDRLEQSVETGHGDDDVAAVDYSRGTAEGSH